MKLIISKKLSDQIGGLKISLAFYKRGHKTVEAKLIEKLSKENMEKQFRVYWKNEGKNKLNDFVRKINLDTIKLCLKEAEKISKMKFKVNKFILVPTLTLGLSGYLDAKQNKIFFGFKSGDITIVHEAVHTLFPSSTNESHLKVYQISEEAYRRVTGITIDSPDKRFLLKDLGHSP